MNLFYIRYILIFLLISFCLSLNGQRFHAGFKAGATATKISGDRDPDGGRPRLGMFASLFTNYPVSNNSLLQLEIMYIQKGSRAFVSGQENDDYRDYRLDLHYVEIPVVYKYNLSDVSILTYAERLTLEAGLSFATVIGHYEENEGADITSSLAEEKPFKSGELNIMAGLYYPLRENLEFHFRFSQGVTPVRPHYDREEVAVSGTLRNWINQFGQYNTALSFGISYTIFTQPVNSSS